MMEFAGEDLEEGRQIRRAPLKAGWEDAVLIFAKPLFGVVSVGWGFAFACYYGVVVRS